MSDGSIIATDRGGRERVRAVAGSGVARGRRQCDRIAPAATRLLNELEPLNSAGVTPFGRAGDGWNCGGPRRGGGVRPSAPAGGLACRGWRVPSRATIQRAASTPQPARVVSRFIDDHVAGAISKAELPLVEIGTAMVTARPSETTSVEYGVRHKVLLYSRGYQQVGALLAPRADRVASLPGRGLRLSRAVLASNGGRRVVRRHVEEQACSDCPAGAGGGAHRGSVERRRPGEWLFAAPAGGPLRETNWQRSVSWREAKATIWAARAARSRSAPHGGFGVAGIWC